MLNHTIILIKSQTNEQIDKWLFIELTVDSGKWTVNGSPSGILLKYIDEVDTITVNCQLSTVHCVACQIPICRAVCFGEKMAFFIDLPRYMR